MNGLIIFNNPEFGEIRTIEADGAPWFVGRDVAAALGYSNTNKALADHVDPEDKRQGDGVTIRDPIGREQHPVIINESGLYSLIMSSKLPGAKRFKRWVTAEVLPSIRKHGAYIGPETLEDMLTSPDLVIKLLTALKAEQEKNRSIERPPVRRIRTLPQAVKEMREADPGTCVTLNALRCWVKSGAIPSTKAGKNFLVDMDALSLFIEGGVADGKYPKN